MFRKMLNLMLLLLGTTKTVVLFLDVDNHDVWKGLHTDTSISTLDFLAKYDKLCNRTQGISWNVYLLQATNTLCLLEAPMLWNKLDHTAETQFPSPLDYHVAPVTTWSYPEYFPGQGFDSSVFRIQKKKKKENIYIISIWKTQAIYIDFSAIKIYKERKIHENAYIYNKWEYMTPTQ